MTETKERNWKEEFDALYPDEISPVEDMILEATYPSYKKIKEEGTPKQIASVRVLIK